MLRTSAVTCLEIWQAGTYHKLPLFMWRMPNQRKKHLVLSLNKNLNAAFHRYDGLPPSIILKPFFGNANFLHVDAELQFYYKNEKSNMCFFGMPDEVKKKTEIFEKLLISIPEKGFNNHTIVGHLVEAADAESKSIYLENVYKAIKTIETTALEKVVLSRMRQVHFPNGFNVVDAFNKLADAYPSAFISALYLPKEDIYWLGASPEYLGSINENGDFFTMSLAGTQPVIKKDMRWTTYKEVIWSDKEYKEQYLVTDYIEDLINKNGIRDYKVHGPMTHQAGNLFHLKTDFYVPNKKENKPSFAYQLISELHPTPAVGGTPKDLAQAFILNHEPHDRLLYSGYIGLVNLHQSTDFFVNLRTMKISGQNAYLFAGCGITKDSIPEKELEETNMKSETLLNIICN